MGCLSVLVPIIFFVFLVILGGSFRTELNISLGVNNGSNFQPVVENVTAEHWCFGLIQGDQPDIQKIIAKNLRHGDTLSEMSIVTKHTWQDVLMCTVTLGIFCPETVSVKLTIQNPSP